VEVCRTCGWNHLATSYLIGTAGARRAAPRRRSRRTAEASD
jgi:hypothetical protein